jgi:hypothetical protein
MARWYRANVAASRRSALSEVRSLFETEELGGARGFLFEVEEDRIEERKYKELRSERDVFFHQHAIQKDTAEIDRLERLYDRKRSEYGRDARHLSPILYVVGLALIIVS